MCLKSYFNNDFILQRYLKYYSQLSVQFALCNSSSLVTQVKYFMQFKCIAESTECRKLNYRINPKTHTTLDFQVLFLVCSPLPHRISLYMLYFCYHYFFFFCLLRHMNRSVLAKKIYLSPTVRTSKLLISTVIDDLCMLGILLVLCWLTCTSFSLMLNK